MTQQVTEYLKTLHVNSGKPTIRELARSTGYGKTTVSEALAGRAVPTWPVTTALVSVMGGDQAEARTRWSAAKGASTVHADQGLEWLIRVRESVPTLPSGRGLSAACVLAQEDPRAAVGDGWEVIRVSALQLSAKYYQDVPGSWSSNVVDTLRRARLDGHLPDWVPEQAALLHTMYVKSLMAEPEEGPSPLTALQYVFLAYRVSWLVRETTFSPGDGT
jgi:helix-turn-helix protein